VELAAGFQLAFDVAVPAGEPLRIGQCRPDLVDVGFEAFFDPHHADPVLGS
jgi:hypothetical protein